MNLPWDLCMHMGYFLLSLLIIPHIPSLTMILLDIIYIPHHPCLLPPLGLHLPLLHNLVLLLLLQRAIFLRFLKFLLIMCLNLLEMRCPIV